MCGATAYVCFGPIADIFRLRLLLQDRRDQCTIRLRTIAIIAEVWQCTVLTRKATQPARNSGMLHHAPFSQSGFFPANSGP
jgi:hypothetical protein